MVGRNARRRSCVVHGAEALILEGGDDANRGGFDRLATRVIGPIAIVAARLSRADDLVGAG
jgi:hypothetical protein